MQQVGSTADWETSSKLFLKGVQVAYDSMSNIQWFVHHLEYPQEVVVVDPGYREPIIAYLKTHALRVHAILVTHYHYDHIDALSYFAKEYPEALVYGPLKKTRRVVNNCLSEGDQFCIFGDVAIQVTEAPGHCREHIVYLIKDSPPHLLVGDVLFVAGCGKIFTRDYAATLETFAKICRFPPETKIYCGHEYSRFNLDFAWQVEPQNATLNATRSKLKQRILDRDFRVVPTSLAEERSYNPFLRLQQPAVRAAIEQHFSVSLCNDAEALKLLRQWKEQGIIATPRHLFKQLLSLLPFKP